MIKNREKIKRKKINNKCKIRKRKRPKIRTKRKVKKEKMNQINKIKKPWQKVSLSEGLTNNYKR